MMNKNACIGKVVKIEKKQSFKQLPLYNASYWGVVDKSEYVMALTGAQSK
jgi:hypothetical protein